MRALLCVMILCPAVCADDARAKAEATWAWAQARARHAARVQATGDRGDRAGLGGVGEVRQPGPESRSPVLLYQPPIQYYQPSPGYYSPSYFQPAFPGGTFYGGGCGPSG
jgi:hypothetical protein